MPKLLTPRNHRHDSLEGRLRDAIASRGLTPYAIALRAGIDPGQVSRFLSGERDLRLATASKIADVFGLRLVELARPKGRPRTAPIPAVEE